MTTTILKKITGIQMIAIFNENSFIRYFETKKLKDIQEIHTYHITIRHNEEEDPNEVLEEAINSKKRDTPHELKPTPFIN